MFRRKSVFTSIPVLLMAACAADVSEGDPDVEGLEQPSICGGGTASWKDVELYVHGELGPDKMSKAFVERHERPVGMVKWHTDFRERYIASGGDPGAYANDKAFCSGTLIAPNLFLTAGHCFDDDADNPVDPGKVLPIDGREAAIRDQGVIFNYQKDAPGHTRAGDEYDILSVEEWRDGGMDYAILELDVSPRTGHWPGEEYGWARVAAVTPRPGDELTVIQHPGGIPKVVDTGTVGSTAFAGFVPTEDLDVGPGTSGSGILDWQGRLMGVFKGEWHDANDVPRCGPGMPNVGVLIEDIVPHSAILGDLVREVGDHSEVLAAGDFDKDGFSDVVIGVPGRSFSSPIAGDVRAGGRVRVIYGDAFGPDLNREQWLDQDTPNVHGDPESGAYFGAAVTVGDFNADRYADLAVGAPGANLAGARNAGGVWIFYGGQGGLSGASSVHFDQEDANLTEVSEDDDRMGAALAAGDFNKDGRDDLAIGSPGEMVGVNAASGMVTVLYGSATGLTSAGNQLFDQNTAIAAAEAEAGDRFGSALAAGDFDKDGSKDLAIGTPYEDLGANPAGGAYVDAGAVSVLYGSVAKLKTRANNRLYQGTVGGLDGVLERGDRLGMSLAAGDLNGDGTTDLVVGAPGEDIGTNMHAGYIHAIYGSANVGLTTNDVGLSEESPSVPGNPESEDRMGMSVSVAQLNASSSTNRAVDVLVGAPGEIIGSVSNAGMVIELFGRQSALLSGTGSVAFHQNTVTPQGDVAGTSELGDRLGTVVLARDLNADGYAEGILAPVGEDINDERPLVTAPEAAPQLMQVLFGSGTGLTTAGNLLFP